MVNQPRDMHEPKGGLANPETTTSLYNGMYQRVIRDAANSQTVSVYGQDGHTVISQVQCNLSTSTPSTSTLSITDRNLASTRSNASAARLAAA